ncbi:hypothetical protein Ahy_A10g048364 [Arachis hypogaea]|uniref:SWIM-type domain-containing protein n=1 Tax=Arachis hypogaea TaxID=3818 RepID=A0A445B4Y6_ARAHY|nr:hypothetical protein Ahy_A10g048364 [Arachis hypogaea]
MVSLLEKELDRYYNNSMYAPFEEEGVVEENAASDGDDFEGVGGHSAESGAEGIDDDVYGDGFYDNWEERGIDRLTDLGCMNLKEIRADHIKMLHFADREVAFAFYNLYAKMNGFAARRYRSRRNMNNEVTQQSFVCFRQGFRKHNDCEERKREPKPETRCGCEAEMRVHVHRESGRWIIIYFQEVHNHKMLEDTLTFMLPGHRMMNAAAINQMNMMLKMRSREAHTDLQSIVGDLVMQTPLHALERSAANSLTREIFLLFRPMLSRACTLKVRSCTYTPMCKIYTLSRSGDAQREWQVSHYPNGTFFKCSCMRMESLGIPCDHIVAVLVHMDATEIPSTLVLGRWSKDARSKVREFMEKGPFCWDSMVNCRNWMLNDLCRELCVVASNDADQFVQVTQKIRNEISRVKGSVKEVGERANVVGSSTLEECVRDPNIARQRTRRRKGSLNHPSVKGVKRCGICRKAGHNRLSCHQRQTRRESESLAARCSPSGEMYDDDDVYYEDISHHEDGDYYIPAHMTDGNVYDDDEELAEQCATVEHEYDISLSEP